MKPHLTLIETHRPQAHDCFTGAPVDYPHVDYDRSPEPDTPIVFTGAEVWFAFFLGGVAVVVVEVVASFAWSFA